MKTSLSPEATRDIVARLRVANLACSSRYPGESGARQPVHTVYGGAHLFRFDSARKLGALAQRALSEHAPDAETFARAIGLPPVLGETVYARVREKLSREPVEDLRIDFEDGYGNRPDLEEDGHAEAAAREVARGLAEATLPPFLGIRIKPFSEELRERSMRTLDVFVTSLVAETRGALPSNFVVTLPKVVIPEQVAALADILEELERATGLARGSLRCEIMIETTQAILDPLGHSTLPLLLAAARGRCAGAHFGTYDYTASCSITAAYQTHTHPACDFARSFMQVAFAGTGVPLSDGATNVMPVPPHKAPKDGPPLSAEQVEENRATVHRAWKLHYDHVRRSLERGYYQGWDLHPAQLPTRYAAVYAFFLESLAAASERLRNFVAKAAQATLVGDVFDDAATGQGLLNYFLRGINCGAISEEEALGTGLTIEELRGRSFVKILKNRRERT
jgi:citrate lyase beta subunit